MAGCAILAENVFLAGVGIEVLNTIHLVFSKTHTEEEACPSDCHGSFGRPDMV